MVLAGGRSTRFGSDKLAASYRGTPLLHHAVLRLAEVTGEVVVAVAPEASEPPLPPGVRVRVARDAVEGQGPLVGLSAGLGQVRTPLALVAAGDMPELSTEVLLEMLRVARGADADAVALADEGRYRPLPVVLRVERASTVARELLDAGERRLRGLLRALRVVLVDEDTWTALDPGRRTLRDVDEPGDVDT